MYCSTWSVNRINPTLSLLRMAEKARTLASSAANSRLLWCAEPKLPDALRSTSSRIVNSRSSVNFFTNGRPARAVTFQSMVRTSSPGDVFAHFVEVHAPALKDGMVFAGQ